MWALGAFQPGSVKTRYGARGSERDTGEREGLNLPPECPTGASARPRTSTAHSSRAKQFAHMGSSRLVVDGGRVWPAWRLAFGGFRAEGGEYEGKCNVRLLTSGVAAEGGIKAPTPDVLTDNPIDTVDGSP